MKTFVGETVESAIQNGLETLNLSAEEVDISIIQVGKKGFFGIGHKEAVVSMEPKKIEPINEESAVFEESFSPNKTKPSQDLEQSIEQKLQQYLEAVTKKMGIPTTVQVVKEQEVLNVQMEADSLGCLIGKHGRMLNAFQQIAQAFVHHLLVENVKVVVNIGNYREKRTIMLENLAIKAASEATATKQPVFLEPMPAFERKQVHAILSKNSEVVTHSEGREPYRYLVVEKRISKK